MDHNNIIHVYSVTVMTHVKALEAGQSSQGTSQPITPVQGRYGPVRGGGAHIVLCSHGLLTCACRLDNIFRSGNIYFGAAIHFSERQNIFQSGKTYFRASIDILEQYYIFQRRRYAHGEDTVRKTS